MRSQTGSLAVEMPPVAEMAWYERRLIAQMTRLRRGSLQVALRTIRPFVLRGTESGPAGNVAIGRPAALLRRLFWRGDLGFAEGFIAGDWTSPNLAALLELLAVNLDVYAESDTRHPLTRATVRMQHWLNRNSRRGSRRNIAAHYDLGNDFYAQWLDSTMTYSAAIFDEGGPLNVAQQRKYAQMLKLLDASPGQHILEIGCGWGGFAEYAARQGFRVTGITLSREQLDYAQARIAKAGLAERVQLRLCDYRDFEGQVDHIVSIEMFEAVGRKYWQSYFSTLSRCLRPGGRVALQVITIDEAYFKAYAANPGGFIQTYIFPGGMLPTKTHLPQLAAAAGLMQKRTAAFGLDYADTLAHWHAKFDRCTEWLEAHGYDERFRRMWRYYLAFCEAGFRARQIDVVQCALARP